MKKLSVVAGVTFDNRQEILRAAHNKNMYNVVTLQKTTYNGEKAIKVMLGQEHIGWIPKKNIESMQKYTALYAVIGYYKKTYNVSLCVAEHPSAKQYAYMKRVCQQTGFEMPKIYDKDVYSATLSLALTAIPVEQ